MLADQAIQRASGRQDPVTGNDKIMREPGSRYIDFLIPGLIGMGIMGNAVWGLGFAIVDARRKKLLKRIIATPMPKHYYLLSFLIWRLLLLVVEVGVPLAFGALVFGVPLRGSALALIAISILGALAFSALGLLVASRVRTIEAISGLANATMVPCGSCQACSFCSGFRICAAASRAAANRSDRRAARQHAAGGWIRANGSASRGARRLDGGLLRPCAEIIPLALKSNRTANVSERPRCRSTSDRILQPSSSSAPRSPSAPYPAGSSARFRHAHRRKVWICALPPE